MLDSVPKTMAMQTQLCKKKIFCLIDFLKKKKIYYVSMGLSIDLQPHRSNEEAL